MSRELFMQRRDSRVAALQYLYAWSMNRPANLAEDLRVFFEGCEQPRDHYAYAEEIIQGVILVFSGAYVLVNLAVDIIYTFLDPRIRY